MLCDLALALLPGGSCLAGPGLRGITDLALAVAVALVLLAAVFGWRKRAGARPILGAGGLLLTLALAAIAAGRPVLVPPGLPDAGLVVAVVDESESLWRDPAAATMALQGLAGALDAMTEGLTLEKRAAWQGAIVGFGETAELRGAPVALDRLGDLLRRFAPARVAGRSDAGAGLDLALAAIRKAGRGVILLLGDGNFAPGVERQVEDALAAGVPVHLWPAGSAWPSAGIIAADIGPEQTVGAPAAVRMTTLGAGRLSVAVAGDGAAAAVANAAVLAPARAEVTFASRGLRSVDLRFETAAAAVQRRLLYTLVRGPARLLVFGAAPWADALDPVRWTVVRADAATPPAPDGFDAVLIDALSPADFPPGYPGQLLRGADGTGLMIVNGGLRGSADKPQRISEWNATVLNPILPVDSDPRKFVEMPPPRDVVLMIDVSGSMGDWKLGAAVAFADKVLDQLRPIDKVAILPFTDSAIPGFGPVTATADRIRPARSFLRGLRAGGGTAPDETVSKAAAMASSYCAFFFLSDNDFAPPAVDPRCYTTVLVVGDSPVSAQVAAWGDVIRMRQGMGLAGVAIPYFEPQEREEYFREGAFVARVSGAGAAMTAATPVPGLAIAYPRADATVANVHRDPPPDSLFVHRTDPKRPGVVTAVFLSDLTAWSHDPQGRGAIEAMLTALTGWSESDRLDIRLRPDRGALVLNVTQLAVATPGPFVLSGQIVDATGTAQPLFFGPGPDPGSLTARLVPRLGEAASEGLLILQEPGHDAQRIPLSLPAASALAGGAAATESLTYGVDLVALAAIADATGGTDLRRASMALAMPTGEIPPQPLHAWFLALALLALCAALWAGDSRP